MTLPGSKSVDQATPAKEKGVRDQQIVPETVQRQQGDEDLDEDAKSKTDSQGMH
ncbi:MAG: hypothetical protein ACXWUX_10890 [Allosphingosinicella sp.]